METKLIFKLQYKINNLLDYKADWESRKFAYKH